MWKMMNRDSNRGFSLIEVMIALVVLSIGLVGLAALLVQGQKYNRSALISSQATFLAYDMADRMRANRAGVNADAYDAIDGTETDPGCIDSTSGCSPTNLAQYDGFAWGGLLSRVLPGGIGTVTEPAWSTDNTEFRVTVSWIEQGANCEGVQNCVVDGNTLEKSVLLTVQP